MNLLLILLTTLIPSDQPNKAQSYFGDAYNDAYAFFLQEKDILKEESRATDCNWKTVAAVTFPEFIRYDQVRNLLEEEALYLGYVNGGAGLVDFSIGRMQMKPSFAEQVEEHLLEHPEVFLKSNIPSYDPEGGPVRRQRLERLQSFAWQVRYACAFVHLMTHRFPFLEEQPYEEQVAFLSAAYNLGPKADEATIRKWMQTEAFPYGSRFKGEQLCYAEVASEFHETINR